MAHKVIIKLHHCADFVVLTVLRERVAEAMHRFRMVEPRRMQVVSMGSHMGASGVLVHKGAV